MVVIETGVIFASIIGMKEGHSLKHCFFNAQEQSSQSSVKQHNI